jgi:cell division transport system ATP-binding protein
MILLDRVTKTYGKEGKAAINRISLHVEPNEFGKIVVGGIDYDTLKDKHIPLLRRKIGVVFQDFKLLPQRTVFENVAFALEIAGMTNREIKNTVPKVIELVGLTGKEKNFPHQLSGGERQRVAIARAVVRQPKILIADEPTGNLDPKHSWDIVRLLEKINKYGTTVLLTTHNADIVNKLKRRVVTLEHGKIISDQAQGSYRQ